MACDISIPKSPKWYLCKNIFVNSLLEIVENADNPIAVTLQSTSGAMGHANLYYGTPGTDITQCVTGPTPMGLVNIPNNSEPSIPIPAKSSALDSASFGADGTWPNPVMIVAKAVLDQSANCQGGAEPQGWDASNPQIAACRFTLVTQQMVRANISVLLPPLFEDNAAHTAFAMSLTSGRDRYGDGRAVRTALRAIVIGTEKREKHIDPLARQLILGYATKKRTWAPSPNVRLALGKERLLLDGPQARASLGQVGPIPANVMRHLMAGPDWQSERDIQIDLSLDVGEVRQALIEAPVPPPDEYYVVMLRHHEIESGAILQERTFIVEPRVSGLREARDRAA